MSTETDLRSNNITYAMLFALVLEIVNTFPESHAIDVIKRNIIEDALDRNLNTARR